MSILKCALVTAALTVVLTSPLEAQPAPGKSKGPTGKSKGPAGKSKYAANRGAKLTFVDSDSAAAEAGLEVDDVIVSINGTKTTSLTHLSKALAAGGGNAELAVINGRDGQSIIVTAYPRNGKLGIDADIVDLDDLDTSGTPYYGSKSGKPGTKSKATGKKSKSPVRKSGKAKL